MNLIAKIIRRRRQERMQMQGGRSGLSSFMVITAFAIQLFSRIPVSGAFFAVLSTSEIMGRNRLRLNAATGSRRYAVPIEREERMSNSHNEEDSCDDDDGKPPYVLKKRNPYDVHVYYSNAEEREAAMKLRSKLHAEFGGWMRFYPPKDRPIGPHPVPMWEADFGGYEHRFKWKAVRDFIKAENCADASNLHSRLSVLIHPHSTGSDYADHTEHAFWHGPVLPLRIGGWKR